MAKPYWISTSSTDPSVGANWSTGSAPANTDDVFIQAIPGLALANIAAHNMSAVTLNSLTISQTYTGTIGDATVPGGYWQIGSALVTIPPVSVSAGTITGSGRIKLNFGASTPIVNIAGTAQLSADAGYEPVRLLGSAIAQVNVSSGTVGIATSAPGETSTVTAINVTGDAIVNAGPGVTWTTGTAASGLGGASTLNLNSGGGTTLSTSSGATATVTGTTSITTVNVGGQTNINVRSGGADVTTLNLLSGGNVSFAGNPAQGTVTTLNVYGGSIQTDPAVLSHLVVTNPPILHGVGNASYS